ncbi:MAG: hypothetical protein L0H53_04660 [Candidatus Nitrosocosmicus sp.]|nr:hypothetical protein [Candidatus Nitrosocosmicus sp.]MDN5867325.1 hypothetical protein [Candidatus Nitrosocosmicus sp.]
MMATLGSFYFTNTFNLVFAQSELNNTIPTNTIANETWLSKRDNLNITIKLDPKVPLIDKWTLIQFEVRKLDSGNLVNSSLTSNITITDHDGRLFKFPEQIISNGKFSVEYIFPDDGQHRIILQFYKNSTAFTVASFVLNIPHPQPSNDFLSWLFQPRLY